MTAMDRYFPPTCSPDSPVASSVTGDFLRHRIEADLNIALTTVADKYSFMRVESYKCLAKILSWSCECEDSLSVFLELYDRSWQPVYSALIKAVEQEPLFDESVVDPLNNQTGKELTVQEQREALKLLQGLCLVHPKTQLTMVKQDALQVLLGRLRSGAGPECMELLAVLLAVQGDATTEPFIHSDGVNKVVEVLQMPEPALRQACLQFLLLLLSTLLPRWQKQSSAPWETERIVFLVTQQVTTILGADIVQQLASQSLDLKDPEAAIEAVEGTVDDILASLG